MTLNSQNVPLIQGYISKQGKVKFLFRDAFGNLHLAKGQYTPANGTNPATIAGTLLKAPINPADERPLGEGEDGTWSATAQIGPVDPDSET